MFKQSKRIFIFSVVISLLSLFTYTVIHNYRIEEENSYFGQIINIETKDEYQIIIIKHKIKNIMIYENGNKKYSVLDYIEVMGTVKEVDSQRVPKSFNYQEYLRNKKIGLVINADSIKVIEKKFNIAYIREILISYTDKFFPKEAKAFIKGLVIGDNKDFSEGFKDSLKINGIMHLFAISGTHIAILVLMFEKILKKFQKKDIIISIFLGVYLIITNFSPSVLRAVLMYYLVIINRRFNLYLSSLDIVSIIFIGLLIYNPFYLENLGFALSFLMAFTIILISPLLTNKNNTFQVFIISLSAVIITLPLVININHQINLLTPFINIVFIVLVGEIMMPLALLSFVFFPFSYFFNFACNSFIKLSTLIAHFFCINVKFPYFSIYYSLIYYGLIIILLMIYKNLKRRYLLLGIIICFFSCFILFNSVNPFLKVVFLDLYHGESTVITYGFKTIIIDTGDGKNNEVTNYLLREGIYKVDYLILTHNHNDHNGEAGLIISTVKVKNTVMSLYDPNNYLYTNNIHLEKEMKINFNKMEILIIPPFFDYPKENDKSLTTYIETDIKMLFLGDIEEDGEKRLNEYKFNVDIVKIAHHGSKTSTGESFLNTVNFKYAIIQSGRIKKFGFPHQEVIENLKYYNKIIYRTDLNYTITYKHKRFFTMNN